MKDVSPNVSLATRATPTITRTGRVVRKPENPDFEDNVIHSADSEIYETVIEEQVIDDQDHHDQEHDDSMNMDMSGNIYTDKDLTVIKILRRSRHSWTRIRFNRTD